MNGLTLHLTTIMKPEEFDPLWPEILTCFEKYVSKFPEYETVEHMCEDVLLGRRDLWVVKDETGKVILTPLTEITTFPTGNKVLTCCEVAGERIQDALPLLEQIEQWAVKNHGVTESHFPGRLGYRKILGSYGYKERTIIFTKQLENANDV